MNKSDLLLNRPGTEQDTNFIYSTWLRSLYYGESWLSHVPKSIFMQKYHAIIESLLDTATIRVVCLKEDTNTILGYVVLSSDESKLYYGYIKKSCRKNGLFKGLLSPNTKTATMLTDVGRSMLKNHSDWVFDPFN